MSNYTDQSTEDLFDKISDLAREASGRDDDDIDWDLTEIAQIMEILCERSTNAICADD